MCVGTELRDVFNGISGGLTCSELRAGYIHSIGTAVYCCDADLYISCRSKQFKLSHQSLEGLELLLC